MSSNPALPADPGGPHLKFDLYGNRLNLVIGATANLMGLLAIVSHAPDALKYGLAGTVIVAGGIFVIWLVSRSHGGTMPIIAYACGVLCVVAGLYFEAAGAKPHEVTLPAYYLRVTVYGDENHDGAMDGMERGVSGIRVTARHDLYGSTTTAVTGPGGQVLVALHDPGTWSIGVCGVFQTHAVDSDDNSPVNADELRIGIDPSHADACR